MSNPEYNISVCTISPRVDADVTVYNKTVADIAHHYNIQCIDAFHSFVDGNLLPIQRYYGFDKIHLSRSGVKRLLSVINFELPIVKDFDQCVFIARRHRVTSQWDTHHVKEHEIRPFKYTKPVPYNS